MNRIITIIVALLLAAAPAIASAQGGKIFRQTKVIFENEVNEGELRLSVFSIPENGQDHYFAALGNLGIGDDIIQFNIDPVSVLYIPLGSTLSEAQAKLEEIKALLKQPVDASMEVPGCLAVGFPDDEYETVTVTHRRPVLQHMLEFSVSRGNLVRATHIAGSDFNPLVSGVKFYRKLHPKEQ